MESVKRDPESVERDPESMERDPESMERDPKNVERDPASLERDLETVKRNSICRLCLKHHHDLMNIFEENDKKETSEFSVYIKMFFSIKITRADPFSTYICKPCRDLVVSICESRVKFRQNDVLLHKTFRYSFKQNEIRQETVNPSIKKIFNNYKKIRITTDLWNINFDARVDLSNSVIPPSIITRNLSEISNIASETIAEENEISNNSTDISNTENNLNLQEIEDALTDTNTQLVLNSNLRSDKLKPQFNENSKSSQTQKRRRNIYSNDPPFRMSADGALNIDTGINKRTKRIHKRPEKYGVPLFHDDTDPDDSFDI